MPRKKALIFKSPERLTPREKLGISQEQYASFCGISKSLLSMIEIGQRDWPLSEKNHIPLLLAFHTAEKEPPDILDLNQREPWECKTWDDRLELLKWEQFKTTHSLKKMVFYYESAVRLLSTCSLLRNTFTDPESIEVCLLDLWELEGKIRIRKNHPDEQQLLQIRLEAMGKEMEVVERVVAGFGADKPA